MTNAFFSTPIPHNEPIYSYASGTKERDFLRQELEKQYNHEIEIPLIIGGKEIKTGNMGTCICPHEHGHVLARYHKAGKKEVAMAIDAALEAKKMWEALPWEERAAVFLKAGELLSTKYRYIINAATMLNQSKNPYQAEIDAVCELADFLRFNPYYMQKIYSEQPMYSPGGMWNRAEFRPLEGFVFAATPFNFTCITANLAATPALMGNVILWKPASTAVLSAYYAALLFKEAGVPNGVLNFIPGPGAAVGDPVFESEHLAGVHFTGSTATFRGMWKKIGDNIHRYKTYPRIVGETGGKDFVVVHNSANAREAAVALVRGAYEYQGQKCSAASRAYIPESLRDEVEKELGSMIEDIKKNTGDPRDFKFFNAVIDETAFDRIMGCIEKAKNSPEADIIFGGTGDKTKGYFIEPTVIRTRDPHFVTMEEEIFGPVLTVYVYDDNKFEETLEICDSTSPYALTGSIFSRDRQAIVKAAEVLRHAAGNFYINDKPTAAVVGQQPFGGSRGSGTNDKAGWHLNLLRWTSPRAIKETFCPPKDYGYPFME
ncbi:MAG: L-glutamate gamma-semialdehyde dehydrogenase [bacterium]|nr:L-glutamate gamma-semialdehyde dehydrogenase [bacterium]